MFVGHYGVSFAVKRADPRIPLWVLFIAVQLVDVFWSIFVLTGIEKVRIVPGFTASNPLDLYYMPYTHSLAGALGWSVIAYVAYRVVAKGDGRGAAWIAFAVFSHWLLDLLVHRPDLSLYDDTMKMGLGLWDHPMIELPLEGAVLFGGIWMYVRMAPEKRIALWTLGAVMMAIQLYTFFGPLPTSPAGAAWSALAGYAVFAAVAAWLERPEAVAGAAAA